jgi:hypothetical protein
MLRGSQRCDLILQLVSFKKNSTVTARQEVEKQCLDGNKEDR